MNKYESGLAINEMTRVARRLLRLTGEREWDLEDIAECAGLDVGEMHKMFTRRRHIPRTPPATRGRLVFHPDMGRELGRVYLEIA